MYILICTRTIIKGKAGKGNRRIKVSYFFGRAHRMRIEAKLGVRQ